MDTKSVILITFSALAAVAVAGCYFVLTKIVVATPAPPFSPSLFVDYYGRFCDLSSASHGVLQRFTHIPEGGDPVLGAVFMLMYYSGFLGPVVAGLFVYTRGKTAKSILQATAAALTVVLSATVLVIISISIQFMCTGSPFRHW